MPLLKNIKEGAAIALALTIGGVALLLFSPFMLFNYLFVRLGFDEDTEDYKDFLRQNEGAQFFAYNNRKATAPFVEEHILPQLPATMGIIFLNGKTPVSALPLHIAQRLLLRSYTKGGMPYLITITNGLPVTVSLNNQLYAAIQHNHPGRLLGRVKELTEHAIS